MDVLYVKEKRLGSEGGSSLAGEHSTTSQGPVQTVRVCCMVWEWPVLGGFGVGEQEFSRDRAERCRGSPWESDGVSVFASRRSFAASQPD